MPGGFIGLVLVMTGFLGHAMAFVYEREIENAVITTIGIGVN